MEEIAISDRFLFILSELELEKLQQKKLYTKKDIQNNINKKKKQRKSEEKPNESIETV